IGVDGPRWFLRGVIGGEAASDPAAAEQVEDLFRLIVVVRGGSPMPPRPHPPEDAVHAGISVSAGEQRDRPEQSAAEPGAADLIGAALGGAARRAGLGAEADESTRAVVWSAMGGWRGILE